MNEFHIPAVSYKPEAAPVTPYQRAADVWDQRIGDARTQAKNWRLAALLTIAYATIATAGLVFQSTKSSVIPYVVRVNGDGLIQAIGPARQTDYRPGRPEIQYFLEQFVGNVRSLPLDPVLAKQHWLSAYDYLRKGAANTLNEIANREQPFSRLGKETVAVRVKSAIPLTRDSWQVRWEETDFSKEGTSTGARGMTGVFYLEITPPKDERTLRVNPLGLYIRSFSWSRDL
jgi:type IV secretion system protein TrbF